MHLIYVIVSSQIHICSTGGALGYCAQASVIWGVVSLKRFLIEGVWDGLAVKTFLMDVLSANNGFTAPEQKQVLDICFHFLDLADWK